MRIRVENRLRFQLIRANGQAKFSLVRLCYYDKWDQRRRVFPVAHMVYAFFDFEDRAVRGSGFDSQCGIFIFSLPVYF